NLGEGAAAVAVVLQTGFRPVGQSGLRKPFPGEIGLLARQGQSGHAATRLADCMFSEASPATANFENMIVRPDLQAIDDAIVFGSLGFLQALCLRVEDG